MSDEQNKSNIELDILSLNEKLRKYLSVQLQPFWKKATEMLNNVYFHIAISNGKKKREEKQDKKQNETQDKESYNIFKYMIKENYIFMVTPKNKLDAMEIVGDSIEEGLRKEIHNQWNIIDTDKLLFGHRQEATYGATGAQQTADGGNVGNFEICWCIHYDGAEYTTVTKLIMKLILEFLCTKIEDINQLKEDGEFGTTDEFAKKYSTFNFREEYVNLIYNEYKQLLPKETCEAISLLPYERRECRGRILVLQKDEYERRIENTMKVDSEIIQAEDFYASYVRKMLEVCQENNYLVVSADEEHKVLGFVPKYNVESDDLVITYEGRANWNVKVGQEEILCYKRGKYYISNHEGEEEYKKQLEEVPGLNINKIVPIISKLEHADHGAILIIAKNAADEANRLCKKYNRGTRVDVKGNINEEFIKDMASVDGAIFVDFDGNCVAYSVILDGEAKVKGELDKGSRFNSSKNYVAKTTDKIAVVVSEDREKGVKILKGWEL